MLVLLRKLSELIVTDVHIYEVYEGNKKQTKKTTKMLHQICIYNITLTYFKFKSCPTTLQSRLASGLRK